MLDNHNNIRSMWAWWRNFTEMPRKPFLLRSGSKRQRVSMRQAAAASPRRARATEGQRNHTPRASRATPCPLNARVLRTKKNKEERCISSPKWAPVVDGCMNTNDDEPGAHRANEELGRLPLPPPKSIVVRLCRALNTRTGAAERRHAADDVHRHCQGARTAPKEKPGVHSPPLILQQLPPRCARVGSASAPRFDLLRQFGQISER